MAPPATSRRPVGPVLLAAVSAAGHLVVGYLYLVAGLVVPGYALLPLWVAWALLAVLLVRLAGARSWWTPLVPIGALALLVGVVALGGQLLGWQA